MAEAFYWLSLWDFKKVTISYGHGHWKWHGIA